MKFCGALALAAVLAVVLLLVADAAAERACNACGPECSGACGTAMFRACCFNFNKKRSLQQLAPQPAQAQQQQQQLNGDNNGNGDSMMGQASTAAFRPAAVAVFSRLRPGWGYDY